LMVGKAITFDTGGISIKPTDKMKQMIFDKCSGMAVLGLMHAVAQLKLPIHVVGILASAENHISRSTVRGRNAVVDQDAIVLRIRDVQLAVLNPDTLGTAHRLRSRCVVRGQRRCREVSLSNHYIRGLIVGGGNAIPDQDAIVIGVGDYQVHSVRGNGGRQPEIAGRRDDVLGGGLEIRLAEH